MPPPPRYIKFCGDASKIPPAFYGQFDIVVSNDAFEHIGPLPQVIEKIYLCLKDKGHLYSYFAPIYSGSCGNHYRLNGQANFTTMEQDGIPNFCHLIWNEPQMRSYFARHPLPQGQAQLDHLCDWSYRNDGISRRLFCDYENIMKNSAFSKFKISSEWDIAPDEKTLEILKRKYPQNSVWANGIIIEAEK